MQNLFDFRHFSICYRHRTLTNPVSPIKCLESIKKYGFVASQYPVIITIEDHLTKELRAKFAEVRNRLLLCLTFSFL